MRVFLHRVFAMLVVLSTSAYAADAPPPGGWEKSAVFQRLRDEVLSLDDKAKLSTHGTMVVGNALYCVVDKAGMRATYALFSDVKATMAEVKPLCAAKQYDAVKNYVLDQYAPRQHTPAVEAVLTCYESNAVAIASIIPDPKNAAKLPVFYSWAQNPALARAQMTGKEICP